MTYKTHLFLNKTQDSKATNLGNRQNAQLLEQSADIASVPPARTKLSE